MYLFIRVCRKHLFAWQQMHVLIAQCYIKILFRLIGTMILRGERKLRRKSQRNGAESAVLICSELDELGLSGEKTFCFSEGSCPANTQLPESLS